MAASGVPSKVHFVGSIPFETPEEVFTTLSSTFGNRLLALTDGEVGDRNNWAFWQIFRLPKAALRPFVLDISNQTADPISEVPSIYTINSVLPTGYDNAALGSYKKFCLLRDEDRIEKGIRFQVSLPTPFAVSGMFVCKEKFAQIEPLYEERLMTSLNRILDSIPHQDLAIQFDIAAEIGFLEYERGNTKIPLFEPHFQPNREGIVDRLVKVCSAIPSDVPLGLHFCYGDLGHVHFAQPPDLGLIVDLANELTSKVHHPIEWIHMPVPKGRKDDAYFAPLEDLQVKDAILALGLVHPHDQEGTKERLTAARRVYSRELGVATECGLGRFPLNEAESILGIMDEITAPAGLSAESSNGPPIHQTSL